MTWRKDADELESKLRKKTFVYLQSGGDMSALAEALYSTKKEQVEFLGRVCSAVCDCLTSRPDYEYQP